MFSTFFKKFSYTALFLAFSLSYSPNSFAMATADLYSNMTASVTWDITNPNANGISVVEIVSAPPPLGGLAIGIAGFNIGGTGWLASDTVNLVNNTETVSGSAILDLHAWALLGFAEAWGASEGTLIITIPNGITAQLDLTGLTAINLASSIGSAAWANLNLAQIVFDGVIQNPPTPTTGLFMYVANGASASYAADGAISYLLNPGIYTVNLDPVSLQMGAVPEPSILFLLGISIIGMLFVRMTRNAQACPISIA